MDFDALYQSGLDLWMGQYSGLYPLTANAVFALLALAPKPTAYGILFALSVAVYAIVLKRDVFLWLLFVPFWQCLVAGQVDILCLGLVANGSGPALALLTLKPQLAIFALPVLVAFPNRIKSMALWTAALHLPMFAIRPTWAWEWIGRMRAEVRWSDPLGMSLWTVPVLAAIAVIAVVLWPHDGFSILAASLNPGLRYYDVVMLAGFSPWAIGASWIALCLCILSNHWWPMSLVGASVYIERWYTRGQNEKDKARRHRR